MTSAAIVIFIIMCNLSDIYVTGINFYKLLISFLMITVWQDKKYKNVTRMEEQVLEGMAYLKAAKRCANINCSGWIRVWSKSLCDYPPLRFFFQIHVDQARFSSIFHCFCQRCSSVGICSRNYLLRASQISGITALPLWHKTCNHFTQLSLEFHATLSFVRAW